MLSISGIVRIFEEIEQRLVQSLKRSLGGGKEYDSTSWQAEKLRSLEKFRKENAELMQEYTEQIDTETRQLMQEQFDEGVTDASTLPAVQEAPEPAFFGVDTTKVNKLIEDMTYLEKNAETAALRMTDDVYRQTVNRVQLAMSTGAMTLQQAIDTAVKDFLNQGINCIVYSDGRRVNIADYVRMALRTTATRAALQGKSAKFKALGYDTVQVSSYSMCSKTCQPWQGRIYIEDTFSWWDGEVQEYPDGTLWGKSNYCGKWFPLLSSAIERGLFHPNCRHTIGLWRDGDPLPESVDNSNTEQRYKLEQQQRALEREIRKAKRKVNGLSDPDNVRKAKAELRQAQKELEDFVDKVNTEYGETVLKPDYGRTTVYEGEVEKPVPLEEPAKPEPEIKEVPEIAPEPPVSDAPVPEGKAVEVAVSEPENAEGAYTDEPIPQAENVNNPSIDNSEKSGTINVEVDEFVPCLKDAETGEIVETEVRKISDKSILSECTEENGWAFPWNTPPENYDIYSLNVKNSNIIEGLIALKPDEKYWGVHMLWGNSAPHNLGKNKKYIGVGGHLFAIAAKVSIDNGYGGFIFADAANKELFDMFIEKYGATPYSTVNRPYRFAFEEDALRRILETYNFDWGDEDG